MIETSNQILDITLGYRLQLFRTIDTSHTKDTPTEKQDPFTLMLLPNSCKDVLHETAVPIIPVFFNLKMDPRLSKWSTSLPSFLWSHCGRRRR
jgi:hypothetical protein